jgi:hypothetical protein
MRSAPAASTLSSGLARSASARREAWPAISLRPASSPER